MKIYKNISSYNERRYGRPYIAKIVLINGKMEPQWGTWIGQNRSEGLEGLLVLDNINAGDIVMMGQRDNRNMRKSAPDYYVVNAEGVLSDITKSDAYKSLSTPPAQSADYAI